MSYSAIVTHDIDFISKYKSVRNLVGSIRRGVGVAKSVSDFKAAKKSRTNDPYFNMEEMLEVNNKFGIPSIFYFMAGKSNEAFDLNDYNVHDPIVKKLIIDLDRKGASIGLHPSYDSYNSFEIIKN